MKATIKGGNRHQSCHKVVHSYEDILGYKAIQILKFLEAKQDFFVARGKTSSSNVGGSSSKCFKDC
jgi:hypothetical protein